MLMHKAGKPLGDIRSTIEETYRTKYRFITPTPHPPHGSPNQP
jgi:hypothetical protein